MDEYEKLIVCIDPKEYTIPPENMETIIDANSVADYHRPKVMLGEDRNKIIELEMFQQENIGIRVDDMEEFDKLFDSLIDYNSGYDYHKMIVQGGKCSLKLRGER